MLLIMLVSGLVIPLSTVMASNGNGLNQVGQAGTGGSASNIAATSEDTSGLNLTQNTNTAGPNKPDDARQYNRTDITPRNQTEQVRAQEQMMFQYRQMTMTMNCTRNCTVIFTADEDVTPKTFSISVDPNQTMTLAMNLTKSPLNGAMVNERCLNFYLGIEPNATLQLQAQIRLYINQTELNQNMNREVNTSRLTWMYWNQTNAQWETVQSYMDQNGYLTCNTNHFSTWTVAETEQTEDTAPSIQNNAFPLDYAVIGAVVIAVVIALGLVAYKKHK